MADSVDTSQIKEWRSIVVLVVFVVTNVIVLFPFSVPIPIPKSIWNAFLGTLRALRIISSKKNVPQRSSSKIGNPGDDDTKIKWLRFPLNFLTVPLVADLFLLAITAIGRKEVHDGTVGADHIYPIEIMAFFITLAYIAISIDASGIIRWLALKVLQKGGSAGHLLFLYLYCFFFALASFIGNDPIVLSGTPFLAYMTRLSSNIRDPKAWIYTQFSVANIASAILVSSNPTNLVLAGAFGIKFIEYTANMIVPVIITVILYFPFLLYYIFRDDGLIPRKIIMHELPPGEPKAPLNPHIPYAGGISEEDKNPDTEEGELLLLEEIMNPYLDKKSATFGSVIMAITLISILVLNAASTKEYPAFWITLPGAVIMLGWDLVYGWKHREETRKISREGRRCVQERRHEESLPNVFSRSDVSADLDQERPMHSVVEDEKADVSSEVKDKTSRPQDQPSESTSAEPGKDQSGMESSTFYSSHQDTAATRGDEVKNEKPDADYSAEGAEPTSLTLITRNAYSWAQETFPTITAVLSHLPLPLVPFGLCMFILVQALVTKGWISVFAYGWNHWVNLTGTIGAIGGMGFLSVVLCNFAGTNIGTAILLCRVVQEWVKIHDASGVPITERTFWATVYSMAVGLNYGAFSTAFSASLAGMLWRSILARKHIHVSARQFAIVNWRLIAFTMIIGCAILVGEVYIIRGDSPYHSG